MIGMAMFILLIAGITVTLLIRVLMREKDIYRIPRHIWAKTTLQTHYLVFEADGWHAVPVDDATEEDISEHAYHMGFGDKAAIEANMENGGGHDYILDQGWIEDRIDRHRKLHLGHPLPWEDEPDAEAEMVELQRRYGNFPRSDDGWEPDFTKDTKR